LRDTGKIFRKAIYDALNGKITYSGSNVPIYDEKKKAGDGTGLYVLFSTEQQTPDNTFDTFMTESTLDLEICHKTDLEVSKDVQDDVANVILEILFPTPVTVGITDPSGFQIQNFSFAGSITRAFMISPSESILRKFIKLKATIVQQF
jgi:hypothetical protein